MSDWITDRRPTINDAYRLNVWVMRDGLIYQQHIHMVFFGEPWAPITPPEPYVKPNRWVAVWSNVLRMWTLHNTSYGDPDVYAYNIGLVCLDYLSKQDEHREAAERVAAIYEEVMP